GPVPAAIDLHRRGIGRGVDSALQWDAQLEQEIPGGRQQFRRGAPWKTERRSWFEGRAVLVGHLDAQCQMQRWLICRYRDVKTSSRNVEEVAGLQRPVEERDRRRRRVEIGRASCRER